MPEDKIIISYDSEKLSAMKNYMEEKNLDFNEETKKAIDVLFKRHVPATVREYIAMKMKNNTVEKSHKTKRQNKKKEVDEHGESLD